MGFKESSSLSAYQGTPYVPLQICCRGRLDALARLASWSRLCELGFAYPYNPCDDHVL